MYWEEKIDRLKKRFSQDEFRVPFSDWSGIMKKMEARFVISNKATYQYNNWPEGLKERIVLRKTTSQAIPTEISKLNHVTNYWVVIGLGNDSMTQLLVYDCKPAAIKDLAAIAPGDFYVGDKKYQWLVYFSMDKTANAVTLIKAGDFPTPFDF
jgi:hypothetical protein